MILLLVIALLVLLALMGTVFILMASTDKQSAYASNSAASLTMAQEGVLNTVRGIMLNQTLDTGNQTLAIGTVSGTTFTAATPQIARFWDYPEVGAMASATAASAPQFYQSVTAGTLATPTQYAPSEPWLVSNPPFEPNYVPNTTTTQTLYAPGEEVYFSDARYVYTGTANAVAGSPGTSVNWFLAPARSTGYATTTGSNTTTGAMPLFSTLTPLLYDPSTGAYDLTWSVGGSASATNIVVPNAAVVEPRWTYNPSSTYANSNYLQPNGTLDAMWNLLPYSDPNGTRYRFAVRIMDTSSFLNLNTGWIANSYTNSSDNNSEASDPNAMYGSYIASAPILNQSGLNINPTDYANAQSNGTPVQTGTSTTPGRLGNYISISPFSTTTTPPSPSQLLPAWQSLLSEYEIQGYFNNSGTIYNTSLFGTNSELDLLTAAGAGGVPFGSPYYSRIATLMPNTLGLAPPPSYYGSGYRGLYTTYSWTRDIAPVNLAGSGTGTAIAPPKIYLNAPPTTTFPQTLYNILVLCGYTPLHACAYVANYFTYRYGVGSGTTTAFVPATVAISGTTATLTAPTASPITTAKFTVAAGLPTATIVGNAAQPFLNQLEVAVTNNSGTDSIVSWGIDINNPFPGTSPIVFGTGAAASDWQLVVPGVGNIDLDTAFPAGIPAYQPGATPTSIEVVIAPSASGPGVTAAPTAKGTVYTGATVGTMPIQGTILLERPGPGGTPLVVDQIAYNFTAVTPGPGQTSYGVLQRDNSGEWSCDSGLATAPAPYVASTDPQSLGIPNTFTFGNLGYDSGAAPAVGVPLYDRFYSGYVAANEPSTAFSTPFPNMPTTTFATATTGYPFLNIDDFNCIAREASYQNATPTYTPLSAQIASNVATSGGMLYATDAQTAGYPMIGHPPAGTPSAEVGQAELYFDFAYDPRAAYTAADSQFSDPVVGAVGEVPPTILSMTTLTDRSSNSANLTATAAALPEGATDLVRQAGKVNINTASQAVLYSLFSDDGYLWNGATPPTPAQLQADDGLLMGDAIAFRARLSPGGGGLPTFVGTVHAPSFPPTGPGTIYPGTGFRSTADLLLAFASTVEQGPPAAFPTAAPTLVTTIQQRDAAWADVENFITVRSDTFAVYGYVEGLRLNPNYTSTAYTPTDWYNANQGIPMGSAGSMSTDVTNANAEFILEGSRRFIAIIDRSYCNNGNVVQPHIVAMKILPQ